MKSVDRMSPDAFKQTVALEKDEEDGTRACMADGIIRFKCMWCCMHWNDELPRRFRILLWAALLQAMGS